MELTQHSKLNSCGLNVFFKHVITSEGSNSLKPQKEIFDYALNKTGATVEESIMIGDSIEVDIAGAIAAGMDQVHVNYNGIEQSLKPTYTMTALRDLKNFL